MPCLVASIALPIALFKVVHELCPSRSASGAIKWGLIAGTLYAFVFWLKNTSNWIYTVMAKGLVYIAAYPKNLFSFFLTAFGLLVIAIYASLLHEKIHRCRKPRRIGSENNRHNHRACWALLPLDLPDMDLLRQQSTMERLVCLVPRAQHGPLGAGNSLGWLAAAVYSNQ